MVKISRSAILALSFSTTYFAGVESFAPRSGSRTKTDLGIGFLQDIFSQNTKTSSSRTCKARDLVKSLLDDEKCFSTEAGAKSFGEACASNVIFEDCFEPEPIIGKENVAEHVMSNVLKKKGRGDVRIDRISDGDMACGFAWTWTSGNEEGLRGTTFVELDEAGKIAYIREIPEPIFKPGDLTVELLKAVTKDAVAKPKPEYEKRTPTTANEVAKYLFLDVQGSEIDESMRFFDNSVIYRDFNYEEVLNGPNEVREFIEDFSFPGIEFSPEKFDDGIDASCFTWEVKLDGQTDTVRGISFYELDPETRKITYVRDVPEPSIKPPPLGRIARLLKPGLGVFDSVPVGSRPGGM